jgi:hypothetical protein
VFQIFVEMDLSGLDKKHVMMEIEITVMLVQILAFQQDVEIILLGLEFNSVMMEITIIMIAV